MQRAPSQVAWTAIALGVVLVSIHGCSTDQPKRTRTEAPRRVPVGVAKQQTPAPAYDGWSTPGTQITDSTMSPSPIDAADEYAPGLGDTPQFESAGPAENATPPAGDGLVAWKIAGAKISPEDGPAAVTIDAADTAVSDAELVLLTTQHRLRHLDLRGTSITDVGLAALAALPQLEFLGLSQTGITDHGVESLPVLASLRYLTLAETAISDACIPSLMQMQSLQGLNVKRTELTRAGIDELKSRLPHCKIIADESPLAATDQLGDRSLARPLEPQLVDPFGDLGALAIRQVSVTAVENSPSLRLSQLLEQYFSDPELLATLGDVYRERGQLREAVASYRQAVMHSHEDPELRYKLGLAEAELGDWQSSLQNLSYAVGPAAAEYNHAVILHRLGRYDECGQALRRSLAVEPGFAPAVEMIAWMQRPGGRAPAPRPAETGTSLDLLLRALQPTTVPPQRARWQVDIQPDSSELVPRIQPVSVMPADHAHEAEPRSRSSQASGYSAPPPGWPRQTR